MVFRRQLFKKVVIVGTGLIGGSIGLALKNKNLGHQIVGVSRRQSSLSAAVKKGAIDEGVADLKKAVHQADFVILAAPVNTIMEHLSQMAKHLKRGCIITDVGSTKREIVETAERLLPKSALFVGSHPMAGSEKSGIQYAKGDLFDGSTCFMTPTERTNRLAKDKVKHFWSLLGAKVILMKPEEHDQTVGAISHVPHLAAFALVKSIEDNALKSASKGFKDLTRIAASESTMWTDICLSNQKNLLGSLDSFVEELSFLRKSLIAKDEKSLARYFKQAKTKREAIER